MVWVGNKMNIRLLMVAKVGFLSMKPGVFGSLKSSWGSIVHRERHSQTGTDFGCSLAKRYCCVSGEGGKGVLLLTVAGRNPANHLGCIMDV